MECPRLDFSDPMGMFARPAKMLVMLISSVRSPREVPVAWHSTSEISLRLKLGHLVGEPHRALLALLRGYEQTASSAVVAEADTPDDAQYGVLVGDRVFQPPQHQNGRAFGRYQSVRASVEGPRSAGATQCLQRAEADMEQQVAGAVDAARQHDVRGVVVQPITRQLDRIQGGGACGVEGRSSRRSIPVRWRRDGPAART